MYAGCVACSHLVSHVEYATRTLLKLEKDAPRPIYVRKTGQTDRRQTDRIITFKNLTNSCLVHGITTFEIP